MKRYFSLILAIAATVSAQIVPSTGNVRGPTSATDNAVARYDGTTGKLIQNSGVTIDDSGNLTVSGTGAFTANTNAPYSVSVTNSSTGASAYSQLSALNSTGTLTSIQTASTGFSGYGAWTSGSSLLYSNTGKLVLMADSGLIDFVSGGTTATMRLNGAGNLLIGTTDDGGQKLQVSGTAALTSRLEINGGTGANTTVTRITPSGWNGLKHRYGAQSSGDTTQFSTNAAMTAATTGNLDDTAVGAGVLNLSGASLQYAIATAGTNPRTFSSAFNVDYSGNATFAGTVKVKNQATLNANGSVAVGTSATTIFSALNTSSANWAFVFGDDGSSGFADLVVTVGNGAAVVVISSATIYGSPPARTYTSNSTNLQLSLASGSLTVRTTSLTPGT